MSTLAPFRGYYASKVDDICNVAVNPLTIGGTSVQAAAVFVPSSKAASVNNVLFIVLSHNIDCSLWANTVDAGVSGFLSVVELNSGTVITPEFANTTVTKLVDLKAGKTYALLYRVVAATLLINSLVFRYGFSNVSVVSNYFANGFETLTLPSGVVKTTDAFGTVTLTFTNVPISAGSLYNLLQARIAKQAGSYFVTSSDTSVFPSFGGPYGVTESVLVALPAFKTVAAWTGTIIVTVPGVGVESAFNSIWLGYNFGEYPSTTPAESRMAQMDFDVNMDDEDLTRKRTRSIMQQTRFKVNPIEIEGQLRNGSFVIDSAVSTNGSNPPTLIARAVKH